jgi:hypothetical protein
MHLYLRIVLDAKSEDYSDEEVERLRECVRSAPGIETVKEIKRHVRGGFSVTAERVGDTVDEIISHLSSSGYQIVI